MQRNTASVIADGSRAQRLSGLPRAIPLMRAEPGPRAALWSPGSLLLSQCLLLLSAAGVEREEMTALARRQHRHPVTTCL